MLLIQAVVRPNKVDAVKAALTALGIVGMTAIECKGYGKQLGHTERYRGVRLEAGFVPKVLVQVCVRRQDKEQAVHAIVEAARTGNVGDGKIFVVPVEQVVRVRTGEKDEAAI